MRRDEQRAGAGGRPDGPRRSRRAAPPTALAAAFVVLALAGCGVEARTTGTNRSARPQTSPTRPADPSLPGARRWTVPPIRFERGAGAEIGAEARLRYWSSSFFPLARGFVPGGITTGSSAGACRVPPIGDALRTRLEATTRRQTPEGTVSRLRDEAILLADCGAAGRWAIVTWTQAHDGRETQWVDELRDLDNGSWSGTARGVQPGCRMPRDAAAAFQLDVTPCPAPAPPRPRPRRAPTPPGAGPPEPLGPGASSA